jgi:hypothetical protein
MPDVGFDVRGQEARGSMDAKRRTVVDPKVRMVGGFRDSRHRHDRSCHDPSSWNDSSQFVTISCHHPSTPQKESAAPVPFPVPSPNQGPPVEIEFLSTGVEAIIL